MEFGNKISEPSAWEDAVGCSCCLSWLSTEVIKGWRSSCRYFRLCRSSMRRRVAMGWTAHQPTENSGWWWWVFVGFHPMNLYTTCKPDISKQQYKVFSTPTTRTTSKLCWQTCQSQTAVWHVHSYSRAVPNSSADTSPAGKGMWASTINLLTQDMDDIDMKNSSSHHPSRASQPWVRFAAESGLWEKKMLLFERTSLQLSLARCSTGKSWKQFLPGNYCWTPPVLD